MRKRTIVLMLLVLLTSGVAFAKSNSEKAFLAKIENSIKENGVFVVAVVDRYSPETAVYEIENLLIDEFKENVRIADRATLNSAFSEIRFQGTGNVSDEDILQIGEMAGAQYAVIKDGDYYRLIDVRSGTVLYNMYKKTKASKKEKKKWGIVVTPDNLFGGFNFYLGVKPTEDVVVENSYDEDVIATVETIVVTPSFEAGYFLTDNFGLSASFGLAFISEDIENEKEYVYEENSTYALVIANRAYFGNRDVIMVYGEGLFDLEGHIGFGAGLKTGGVTFGFNSLNEIISIGLGLVLDPRLY